ncbi:MAG: ATP-dependent Clp protease adapter ClpS [Syntrophales bacterium]|jgi:ATP-dependent Clp protease adaptor protein ClpS|nr:ATP-dependent Clp protease adapter ClpS [Syntrophales bacterium]NLN60533.1 ATP-dependent Clp protease adapter ClpS [Deltaproteobacteria bacterium]
MPERPSRERDPGLSEETEDKPELRQPKMYRVILHNDHYTTMDFVVDVLVKVFHKPAVEATKIMLDVHRRGRGVCGTYTYDIAVTKINRVQTMARMREYPLRCTMEEE